MIIANAQLAKLSERMDEQFIDDLTQMLREQPGAGRAVPSAELRADVKRLVTRAQHYGMGTERDAASFVVTAFLLGEDFDHNFKAAGPVLTSTRLSGAEKAAWLEEWTTLMFSTLEEGRQ
jgi:hypothetical protein